VRAFGRNTKGGKYRNSKKQFGDDFNTYMNKQNQQDKSQQLYENEEVFENLMETNRKMSHVEKWYEVEADQGETKHITKYVVKNMQDVKTLDVKILELRENPDNI
jgi:succinate dehydrogenase/fumarate reductase flavoprotein subunit